MRWIFGAAASVAAVAAAILWLGGSGDGATGPTDAAGPGPGAALAAATAPRARVASQGRDDRDLGEPSPGRDPVAADTATAPVRRADPEPRPTGEHLARIEEEVRSTDAAIAASRRLSGVPEVEKDVENAKPASRARSAPGVSVTTLCRAAGSTCTSSADCCPGLSCAGGVAGYGTAGTCAR